MDKLEKFLTGELTPLQKFPGGTSQGPRRGIPGEKLLHSPGEKSFRVLGEKSLQVIAENPHHMPGEIPFHSPGEKSQREKQQIMRNNNNNDDTGDTVPQSS